VDNVPFPQRAIRPCRRPKKHTIISKTSLGKGGFSAARRANASPVGRPRKAGFLMQPEGTRAKAGGNEEVFYLHCAAKANEPYGIAELSAVRLTEGLSAEP
jgi:hypothetical protein